MGTRLRATVRISGQSNSWKGSVIVDSGAPESVVDSRILKQIGAECTGEFARGVSGGANTQAGYNNFWVGIESEVAPTVKLKVFQADMGHTDTRALLGMDWLGIANPEVDWVTGKMGRTMQGPSVESPRSHPKAWWTTTQFD